ncbi:hypothetical protein LMB21_09425 [Limosilactobacillus reuteri]|uniref:hypothetical protein n=1 Tax=Limosilactobacillus reuteri TaxID=1598 RepID=UPI001E3415FF|nr:hypothetical protein [Limosilactobacillus reuteri]MCC4367517.1 hypothetical protein [Limosilactobacillus reuteri]
MSYDPTIEALITARVNKASDAQGTFYLPDCNQQDVVDTVNYLHAKFPTVIY